MPSFTEWKPAPGLAWPRLPLLAPEPESSARLTVGGAVSAATRAAASPSGPASWSRSVVLAPIVSAGRGASSRFSASRSPAPVGRPSVYWLTAELSSGIRNSAAVAGAAWVASTIAAVQNAAPMSRGWKFIANGEEGRAVVRPTLVA